MLSTILLLFSLSSVEVESRERRGVMMPNEILVSTRRPIAGVVRRVGRATERIADLDVWVVRLHPGLSVKDALVTLSLDPRVLFAEPHLIGRTAATPNDPCWNNSAPVECDGHSQWAPQRVLADLAWDLWRPRQRVRLAISDTGVDNDHPDLAPKMLRDEDGIIGYNAFSQNRSSADDPAGHGTWVAGVAAARINNGFGMAGIAAWSPTSTDNWIKIMPIKSSREQDYVIAGINFGNTPAGAAARGVRWATNRDAGVINMSWSFPHAPVEYETWGFLSNTPTLKEALRRAWRKDVVLIACAGNEGTSNPTIPGQFRGVMAVGATRRPADIAACDSGVLRDRLRGDSNHGDWVDIAAPGDEVMTTQRGGGYLARGQTSIAAPHVSGAAALIRAHNPNINNDFVVRALRETARPLSCASGHQIDGGMLDVQAALVHAGNPLLTLTISPSEIDLLGAVPRGTVTLTASGPHPSLVIQLSTLHPQQVAVPATVVIPWNASSAQFEIDVNDIPRGGKTTIVARGPGNGVAAAPLFVNPILHSMRDVFMDRDVIVHGAEMAMDIALDEIPRTDVVVTLTSTHPEVLPVPATTTIAALHENKILLLRAGRVSEPTAVTITASIGQSLVRKTVTVRPR